MFEGWIALAERNEVNDPNAIALSTVDCNGLPNVRMVFLKSAGPNGFVFFTKAGSQNGRELAASPKCAAVLHWKSLQRQVRLQGTVSLVSNVEADAYFASSSRESKIGTWSSRQSQPLSSRKELEEAVAREAARFGADEIPRPPYWTGFRIAADHIEFWISRPIRLHDRLVYHRDTQTDSWIVQRLYP